MSRRDTAVALRDMLDYTREAVAMGHNRSRADLDADRQFNLALVRLLEVIGEAARRVSAEERLRHPEIKWKQIIGLRNRLVHAYDFVDFDILWEIVTTDLPPLITALEQAVGI